VPVKGISRVKLLSVSDLKLLPQLESWNFVHIFLILRSKKLWGDFWNFVWGLRYGRFSVLVQPRQASVPPLARPPGPRSCCIWGICMKNFSCLASRLREEREVAEGREHDTIIYHSHAHKSKKLSWSLVEGTHFSSYNFGWRSKGCGFKPQPELNLIFDPRWQK